LKITYDAYAGLQEVAKRLDMMNGEEYMTYLNEQTVASGGSEIFTQQEIRNVGVGTDWQDEIFQMAPIQNHNLSLSGGSENSQYYISFNHIDQEGVIKNMDFQRTGARVNFNHSMDKLHFGLMLNTSRVNDKSVPYGGVNLGAGVLQAALQMPPNEPVFDEDGLYHESMDVDLVNPVAQANTIYTTGVTDRITTNVFTEYEIFNNLKAKINLGNDRRSNRNDYYATRLNRRGAQLDGTGTVSENNNSSSLIELTLSYVKEFSNSSLSAVGGYTYQQFNYNAMSANAERFPTDAFLSDNMGAGDQATFGIGSNKNKSQLLSWLGRVNYTLLDRYLITASFRADGSSRFGADHKYGYFPSLALAWRMSNEAFLTNLNFLSDLKLRLSYGMTGNQEIGNYNSLVLLGTVGQAIFDDQRNVGISPTQMGNADLKWETTGQFDAGIDYGLFNNRITGTLDYFIKNTFDLLLNLPIPSTSGFSSSLQNVGDTRNKGFEFLIDTKNTVGKFMWSTSFNFSSIRNEVTNLGNLPDIKQGSIRFIPDITILTVGKPMNSYYGYLVEGVFQTTEEIASSAQKSAKPGDLRYKDVNDDGSISIADRTILGDPFANLVFGLNNRFSYYGFNLELFMEGTYGNELLNVTKTQTENPIENRRNRHAYALDRWTAGNPSTTNPSFMTNDYTKAVTNRVVEDASYLRAKYLRLSYEFPKLNVKGISSLSVYATGQNILTFSKYSGYDPAATFYDESNIRIDYNNHPLVRMYTLGIKIVLK